MKIAVTVRSGDDVQLLRLLIENVRAGIKEAEVTILEAPKGLDYPFPFPVVTISQGAGRDRHFGAEAVSVLEDFAKQRAAG